MIWQRRIDQWKTKTRNKGVMNCNFQAGWVRRKGRKKRNQLNERRILLIYTHTSQRGRLGQLALDLAISTAFDSSIRASKTAWRSPTTATVTSCLKKHQGRYLEPEAFVGLRVQRRADLNEREGSTLLPVKTIAETRVATKGRFSAT
jgi:hypothetical protein